MEEEKKIKFPTTGTYDFPKLILGGKGKYVDKTDLLYRLATTPTNSSSSRVRAGSASRSCSRR